LASATEKDSDEENSEKSKVAGRFIVQRMGGMSSPSNDIRRYKNI